ncbi:hypothetical protein [Nocardia salmonicida]|uniref:hypothetical protein n=1 Tax=Nocardia salmonicida TaxID=53431 RepID=UPI0037B09251
MSDPRGEFQPVTYTSPFGDPETDHDSDEDVLCVSRAHPINTLGSTLTEYARAAQAAIDAQAAQPAFFLARQLAELSLKALYPSYTTVKPLKSSHILTDFLDALEAAGDPLLGAGETERDIVSFIRDLARHDSAGDQGRYYTTKNGQPSLATVCCADRDLLSRWVWTLENYVIDSLEPGCIRPISS